MSELGKYSNDPSKAAEEEAAKWQAAYRDIGPYRLTKDPRVQLWAVARIDGKPVPQGLSGRWTSLDDFRNAAANFESKRAE